MVDPSGYGEATRDDADIDHILERWEQIEEQGTAVTEKE
jgi:hypothetical protein